MRKLQPVAGLAATALIAGAALAQTSPAPTQPAGSGQVITQMTPDLMRGSKLTGGRCTMGGSARCVPD
jgi:hypothetical protein